MKNTASEEMLAFIDKAKSVMLNLYDEYNSIDSTGLHFACPLSDIIDDMYNFSLMDINETIEAY